jgi:adenine/guanine phosphoribosyltransferase-like PRPP-binding protein
MDRLTPYHCNIPIGRRGEASVVVRESPLGHRVSDLFSCALRRDNPQRPLFFVSHVLGKQRAIDPRVLGRFTRALANVYAARRGWSADLHVPHPTLVIAFAETATAMGQCVFDALRGDVTFCHSTRERVPGREPLLSAREAHSHAPEHYVYLEDRAALQRAREVLIVDDEITTGNTAASLIADIERIAPGKHYGILSLLDWQPQPSAAAQITRAALLRGDFSIAGSLRSVPPVLNELPPSDAVPGRWQRHTLQLPTLRDAPRFVQASGRFGIDPSQRSALERALAERARVLVTQRRGRRTLCLGSGECMYIPLRLAQALGERVAYQATTRSPAIPVPELNYGIVSGAQFRAPQDPQRIEYLYNVAAHEYDEVFLFLESSHVRAHEASLLCALESYEFTHKHVVVLGE